MGHRDQVTQTPNALHAPRTGPSRRLGWPVAVAAIWLALLLFSGMACGSGAAPIVFTSDRDGNLDVYAVDPDSHEETNLTSSLRDESSPVVSPDGKLIAFLSGSGDEVVIEVMDLEGESRTRVTPGSGKHRSQRWSPTSKRIVYVAEQEGAMPLIHLVNADGSDSLLLTSMSGDEVGGWSRDGTSVAFTVLRGAGQGIYVRNPDGVNEFRATETPDNSPVWSPDSRRLAFLSTRDGNPEIYVMELENPDQQTRITESDAAEYHVSWSPNGKRLLFVSERDGNPEIYLSESDGTEQTRLTRNTARDELPVWSPDGKRIAFVSYLDGDAEIFVMDAEGRDQTRLTNNDAKDTDPSW